MKTVVEAKGLVKRLADKNVIDGLSLEIHQGEIFGLLGPNGAGKTSLLKMMYGTSQITSGELFVLGLNAKMNFREIKSRVGVIPQEDGLDTEFTVLENLLIFGQYHLIDKQVVLSRANELLRLMRLEKEKNKYIHELSGGMKRRLAIARGMMNNPQVIFLDEPTTGLDPDVRFWIWDFLEKIKAEMGTVIISTHYMEEAEKLCDRIAILENGKILEIGTPKSLIEEQIGKEVIELEVSISDIPYYVNRLKEKQYRYLVVGKKIHVHLSESQNNKDVLELIFSQNISIRKPNLNDVFLRLAGHDIKGESL